MRERKREREKKNTVMTMVCSQITGGLRRYSTFHTAVGRGRTEKMEGGKRRELENRAKREKKRNKKRKRGRE